MVVLTSSTIFGSPPIVRVFEMQNITSATIANQVKLLLDSLGLLNKFITYVKDIGSNLNTLTNVLKFKVSCSPLQLFTPFVGSCFGHAMLKET
jgi:hypothetical protein